MIEYLCSDGEIRTLKELEGIKINIIQKRTSFNVGAKRLYSKYRGQRFQEKLTGSNEWVLT